MNNNDVNYFKTPAKSNVGHNLFWAAYCLVAVAVCFFTFVMGSFLHLFILAIAFIFGPKIWKLLG